MIWNKEMETMNRKDMEALQLERLKHLVDYCYRNVPFYTKKLDAAGVTADKIKCLRDIEYIPPTTKADLRDNYPFGLFAKPAKELVRIHASSGTTGKPTVVGYTRNDLDNWSEQVARVVTAAGATDEDIVQICFGYGMFTGALGLHYGLEKIGATVVPTSSGNTEKQLMFMRDFKTSAIVATPSYALYLAEAAKGLEFPMDEYNIQLGLLGSEGCTVEMRSQIEKAWGLFSTDNYGMSELNGPGLAGECRERDGLHIAEDHFLCEVVDSNTLEAVEAGQAGELLVSTLTKESIPLLRYRTRDITSINYEPCKCGRTSARMAKIMGRSDDMLKIRGVNVFPSQVESCFVGMANIAPHYQLIIRREGYHDTMEVKVEIAETCPVDSYPQLEETRAAIQRKLLSVLGLKCKVTLVESKSLERFTGKAQRIVDLRNQ